MLAVVALGKHMRLTRALFDLSWSQIDDLSGSPPFVPRYARRIGACLLLVLARHCPAGLAVFEQQQVPGTKRTFRERPADLQACTPSVQPRGTGWTRSRRLSSGMAAFRNEGRLHDDHSDTDAEHRPVECAGTRDVATRAAGERPGAGYRDHVRAWGQCP